MKLFTVGVTGTQSGMNPEHMRSWEGVLYVVWKMWLTILIMGSVGSKK